MNSLQDLNGFSANGIPYNDDRSFFIAYDVPAGVDQTQTVLEDTTHTVKTGANITELYGVTANSVSYTVNVSSVSGATVTWPSPLPEFVIATNPSTGVYTLANITGVSIWDAIKSPTITMPTDWANNWSYTANITSDTLGRGWNNYITVIDTAEFTQPGNITYNENYSVTIINQPTIVDVSGSTYELFVSPSTTSAISSLNVSGDANVTFNSNTKTLTFGVANKDTQNTRLTSIVLTPAVNFNSNFSLNYRLRNTVSNTWSNVSQSVNIGALGPVMTTPITQTYDQNTDTLITGYPQITSANAIFTVNVAANAESAVRFISSNAYGTWNGVTKKLNITGNLEYVNAGLGNIIVRPGVEYNQPFQLVYTARQNIVGASESVKLQEITYGNTPSKLTTVSNISYIQDTVKDLIGVPTIRFPEWSELYSENYVYEVSASPSAAVSNIWPTINASIASFNNTTKVLRLEANGYTINDTLTNLKMTPTTGYNTNFNLFYYVDYPTAGITANVVQGVTISSFNPTISNATETRYYSQNSLQKLFPNLVPQIQANTVSTYRVEIQLGSNVGYISSGNVLYEQPTEWSYGNLTYFVSNTKANVNSTLDNTYFIPHIDTFSNATATIREYNNNILQSQNTFNLIGNVGLGNISVYTTTTVVETSIEDGYSYPDGRYISGPGANVSTSFTPSFAQVKHLKANVLLIGGGGASGQNLWTGTNYINESGANVAIPTNPTQLSGGTGGKGGIVYDVDTSAFKNNYSIAGDNSVVLWAGRGGRWHDSITRTVIPRESGIDSYITMGGTELYRAYGGGAGAPAGNIFAFTKRQSDGAIISCTYANVGTTPALPGGSGGGAPQVAPWGNTTQTTGGANIGTLQGTRGGNTTIIGGGTYSTAGAGGRKISWINGNIDHPGAFNYTFGQTIRTHMTTRPTFTFKGNLANLPTANVALGDMYYHTTSTPPMLKWWTGTGYDGTTTTIGVVSDITGTVRTYANGVSGTATYSPVHDPGASGGGNNGWISTPPNWWLGKPMEFQVYRNGQGGIVAIKFWR